jgi:hypothetical protein
VAELSFGARPNALTYCREVVGCSILSTRNQKGMLVGDQQLALARDGSCRLQQSPVLRF